MEYVFMGFEKREYTNKNNKLVTGYNVYYAYTGDNHFGFKPAMRFDQARKSLGYCYLSQAQFERLGLSGIAPLSKVYMTFNQFGGIETVRSAK